MGHPGIQLGVSLPFQYDQNLAYNILLCNILCSSSSGLISFLDNVSTINYFFAYLDPI